MYIGVSAEKPPIVMPRSARLRMAIQNFSFVTQRKRSQNPAPVIARIKQVIRRPKGKAGERRALVTNGPRIAIKAVIERNNVKFKSVTLGQALCHSALAGAG
jgi:hypothetical protein